MPIDLSQLEIRHNSERQRFEAPLGDALAVVEYVRSGPAILFTHTGVPLAFQGQGIAGRLAQYALDYARAQGWRVQPLCSYIAAYIERHPEYQSLVSAE